MTILEPIDDKDLDLKNKLTEDESKIKRETHSTESGQAPKKEEARVFLAETPMKREAGLVEKDDAYAKILSKVQKTPVPNPVLPQAVTEDAHRTSQENSAEAKVDRLVHMAMDKGVAHAVNVAKHLDDNYTLDEFHDRLLADDLHDALVKKGLIKEI